MAEATSLPMIAVHDFNTRWWGRPVGVIRDAAFFRLSRDERQRLLGEFAWVEFRRELARIEEAVDLREAAATGFFQVDTQISYRLNLRQLPRPDSLASLAVEFADEHAFTIAAADVMPFASERFSLLPGATQAMIDQRYALWSCDHLREHPAQSVRVLADGEVQGWMLADATRGPGLNLTLGMLSRNARVSGALVWLSAFHAFSERGFRLGRASFSVRNSSVHNIYAGIGARFLGPAGQWFWVAPD